LGTLSDSESAPTFRSYKLTSRMLKEALSLKFGGMEELGEKMCIIGELGKLLLEEVPLEETPPGYGRAPYNGYEKTANAANEAARCVSLFFIFAVQS
jgi:hypothetical protein